MPYRLPELSQDSLLLEICNHFGYFAKNYKKEILWEFTGLLLERIRRAKGKGTYLLCLPSRGRSWKGKEPATWVWWQVENTRGKYYFGSWLPTIQLPQQVVQVILHLMFHVLCNAQSRLCYRSQNNMCKLFPYQKPTDPPQRKVYVFWFRLYQKSMSKGSTGNLCLLPDSNFLTSLVYLDLYT